MTLKIELNVASTPYADVIPHPQFVRLATDVVRFGAGLIEKGGYEDSSFGLCILDPSAPFWMRSQDIVLITAAIGENGRNYVMNAIDKTVQTRDHGEEWGNVLYTQPHRIPGGAFRWGFAACIDGTYVGGSAQSQLEDRMICSQIGAFYNFVVAVDFEEWGGVHPRQRDDGPSHSWFTNSGVAPGWLQDHPMTGFDGEAVIRLG